MHYNAKLRFFVLLFAIAVGQGAVAQVFESYSFKSSGGFANSQTLISGNDGNIYGITKGGGTNEAGAIFKLTPDGTLSDMYSFQREGHAWVPVSLLQGSDGYLYGLTGAGSPVGTGAVFRVDYEGNFTTLLTITTNEGGYFWNLTEASDGTFYVNTLLKGVGKLTRNGVLTHVVPSRTNFYPSIAFQAKDNHLYGTTTSRTSPETNSIFRLTLDGQYTVIASFTNVSPTSLMQGHDGNLYFGSMNKVFSLTLDGTVTLLTTVTDYVRHMTPARDGKIYVIDSNAGRSSPTTNFGRIATVTTNGVYARLEYFDLTNGAYAEKRLLEASDGCLYGTTQLGGESIAYTTNGGYGTVFQVTTNGAFRTLVSFHGTNGMTPQSGLIEGPNGMLYGLARGGTNMEGTIYRISTRPTLSSTRVDTNVVLTWPGAFPNYFVEQRDLQPGSDWQPFVQIPLSNHGKFSVSIPIAGVSNSFFRLRRP